MKESTNARIAIFASGSGSNAEAIMNYFNDHPAIKVSLVMSNSAHAQVLRRAFKFGISAEVFTKEEFKDSHHFLGKLKKEQITHIVLAGFLWMIPEYLLKAFPNRIINIHPSLLPRFGGKGMYGMHVHEAVKNSGVSQTGITIHLVNEKYDEGEILLQASCPIEANDSLSAIALKVQKLEHLHYPGVIENWVAGQPIT